MIVRMSREFIRANSGFTVVEFAFSMAIGSLIIGGMVTSIGQLTSLPAKVQDSSVVTHQAQNFSYWLSRDAQMMQTFTAGDNPGTPENEVFTFSWVCVKRTDASDNDYIDTFTVRYARDGGRLWRYERLHTDKYSSNGNFVNSTDTQKTTAIADYTSEMAGSLANGMLSVSATFSYGNAEVRRTYDITPRANIIN